MKKKSTFAFKKPEDSYGFLLWKTSTIWHRGIKKIVELYDLSHAQFVIMAVTKWFNENNIKATQIDVANKTGLDKMTVSKSLKKLISLGYVVREENPSDTRSKLVILTDEGASIIKTIVPAIETVDKEFFSSLSSSERQTITRYLQKLIEKY